MWPVDLAQDVCAATIYKVLEQATSYKLSLQATIYTPIHATIYNLQDCSQRCEVCKETFSHSS